MNKLNKSETVTAAMWNLTASDEQIQAAQATYSSTFGECDAEQIVAIRDAARNIVSAWLIGMSLDSREWTHEGFEKIRGLTAKSEEPLSIEYVDRA